MTMRRFTPSSALADGVSEWFENDSFETTTCDLHESIHVVREGRVNQAIAAMAPSVTREYLRHTAGHGDFRLRQVHTDGGTRWQVRDGHGGLVAGSFDVDTALRVCGALNLEVTK